MTDQLLPQPPPDAPAPPPSEEALRSRGKFGGMIVIGLISIILILLIAPMFFRSRKASPRFKVWSNARFIGHALSEFDSKFGKFPDASTIEAVKTESGTKLTLTDHSSNDLFAQLIVSGVGFNEYTFYAKAEFSHLPDFICDTDATILEHGECGFAYIPGMDSKASPDIPIVFGPVSPGTTTVDTTYCEGVAVVLTVNGSVKSYSVNSAGKIIINGLDLLDPRQPFWHGKAPVVKWPK